MLPGQNTATLRGPWRDIKRLALEDVDFEYKTQEGG